MPESAPSSIPYCSSYQARACFPWSDIRLSRRSALITFFPPAHPLLSCARIRCLPASPLIIAEGRPRACASATSAFLHSFNVLQPLSGFVSDMWIHVAHLISRSAVLRGETNHTMLFRLRKAMKSHTSGEADWDFCCVLACLPACRDY